MKRILLGFFFTCIYFVAIAGRISGKVTDDNGHPLAFASVYIKGTTKGTTTNSLGIFFLTLDPGNYTVVCQFVGYQRQEKDVAMKGEEISLDFRLSIQETSLQEVVIKNGEDPAYEVIRQAIRKRDYYNSQVDSFTVQVYIKGLMRSRGLPDKVFGQKIKIDSADGLDSAGKGIIFLSESVTKVSYQKPDKLKYEVISSRQSGGGLGISFPFFINFYTNNVTLFNDVVNRRGFVSPIADNALYYYRYKLEGTFFEDKKMVNHIKVIPRRKNEPLFEGYIDIVEDDWRIHSLDLLTTKDYQLELVDTIRIAQNHIPVEADIWRIKNQVVYVTTGLLGFNMAGNFVNVYNDYDLHPGFDRKYFGRVFMKYDSTYNKKDSTYWETIRPVPLEPDEKRDYIFKDSISQLMRDSMFSRRNIDSLRKKQKPMTLKGILWAGDAHTFYTQKVFTTYRIEPLVKMLQYNTVDGLAINLNQSLQFRPRKGKQQITIDWLTRYGVSNSHLNSYLILNFSPKAASYRMRYFRISGGKRLSQFNAENPVAPFMNAVYTLFSRRNYLKVYENWFGSLEYNNRLENGLSLQVNVTYEDRLPVFNSTDFSFYKKNNREFLPNLPYELQGYSFVAHKALTTAVTFSFQPGIRYIEFPGRKVPLSSKWPVFAFRYKKGINGVLNSVVNYDKWNFSVQDDLNLKLKGEFRYRIGIGGFINSHHVEIPDLKHFNGNRFFYNTKYLNSFQLAPYYKYSNEESFYIMAHAEHHFNGLLTNKIPLFNKLKWNLVGGTNTFYVTKTNYYAEGFIGLENIFKILRVDFITAWQPGAGNRYGVRVGFGGIFGRMVRFDPGL